MHSAVAHSYLYNIIFVFLFIIFAFVIGIVVYYKSFKINKNMLSIIEKYEGYNSLSKRDIDTALNNIGYNVIGNECTSRVNVEKTYAGDNNKYCVYLYRIENESSSRYYTYGVTTYITFDFPFGFAIKIPIHTKSNRIYKFRDGQSAPEPGFVG